MEKIDMETVTIMAPYYFILEEMSSLSSGTIGG